MKGLTFQEAVLTGLADDEGLLVPELIPNVASHLQVCLFIVVFVLCVVVCGSSRRHARTQAYAARRAHIHIHYITTLHVIIHNNILYDRTIIHARTQARMRSDHATRTRRTRMRFTLHPLLHTTLLSSYYLFMFFCFFSLFVVYINLVIFQKWENLSFAELSLEIMSLFVSEDEIPRAGLRRERGR